MNVSEFCIKAGIPLSPSLSVGAGQIRDVLDRRAETRWADHRTISAIEASRRNLVPVWTFQIAVDELSDSGRVYFSLDHVGCFFHRLCSLLTSVFGGFRVLKSLDGLHTLGTSYLNQKSVRLGQDELRQTEVKISLDLGSGSH